MGLLLAGQSKNNGETAAMAQVISHSEENDKEQGELRDRESNDSKAPEGTAQVTTYLAENIQGLGKLEEFSVEGIENVE